MEQSLIGFEKELRRFEATNEFHNAFKLCLDNMKNPLLDYDFLKELDSYPHKTVYAKIILLNLSLSHFVNV